MKASSITDHATQKVARKQRSHAGGGTSRRLRLEAGCPAQHALPQQRPPAPLARAPASRCTSLAGWRSSPASAVRYHIYGGLRCKAKTLNSYTLLVQGYRSEFQISKFINPKYNFLKILSHTRLLDLCMTRTPISLEHPHVCLPLDAGYSDPCLKELTYQLAAAPSTRMPV